MPLKKLTPRHRDIARRLVLAETPKEIALELGMHTDSILRLIRDEPLFASYLYDLEQKATKNLIDNIAAVRLDAVKIIEDASGRAAQLCKETLDDSGAALGLRLRSAWDILDRKAETSKKGAGAPKGMVDLTELIIEAARRREMKEKPIDVTPKLPAE